MTLRMRRPALRLMTSGALRDTVSSWLSHIALWLISVKAVHGKRHSIHCNVNALVYAKKTTAAAAFDNAYSETRLLTVHSAAEAPEFFPPHITDVVVEHYPAGHRTCQSGQCSCAVVRKQASAQITKAQPGQTGQCAALYFLRSVVTLQRASAQLRDVTLALQLRDVTLAQRSCKASSLSGCSAARAQLPPLVPAGCLREQGAAGC